MVERVAVLGCGFFAQYHVQAWAQLDGAELVAVCDRDEARAEAAGRLGRAAAFTDAAQMLAEARPDVVDIVTMPDSHLPLARLCAEAGADVIVQKPLTMRLEDSVRLADMAEATGARMMVHENFRFQAPIRRLRDIVAAGTIGKPLHAQVSFRTWYDPFARDGDLQRRGRILLMDMGVHVFDVARFLLGEISELSARTLAARLPGDDVATALVGFEGGAIGVVDCSAVARRPDLRPLETHIAVEGTEGAAVLLPRYEIAVRVGDETTTESAEPAGPSWGGRPWHVVQDSVVNTCRHWLEAKAAGIAPETSLADNLMTLAAVEAAYLSAERKGARVAVGEVLDDARRAARG